MRPMEICSEGNKFCFDFKKKKEGEYNYYLAFEIKFASFERKIKRNTTLLFCYIFIFIILAWNKEIYIQEKINIGKCLVLTHGKLINTFD
jgi:hypothetical protein